MYTLYIGPGVCSQGDLQLTGGSSPEEGTVELCYSSQWHTVCDDAWDELDAVVVCRQLRLPESGIVFIEDC